MDRSLSTLAPLFAAVLATRDPHVAFLGGAVIVATGVVLGGAA